MPLNDPRSTLAFIDEGGNPFGNIPEHAELCIRSTEMLREREDLTIIGWAPEEQPASSRSQNNHYGQAPMPPRMAVKVGSNFGNRRNIISLETMKQQIVDMLKDRPEKEQAKRPQFRRIVAQPPAEDKTAKEKWEAQMASLEEAQERLYMEISNQRVPHFRHQEDNAEHRLRLATDPNPIDRNGNDAGSPGTGI